MPDPEPTPVYTPLTWDDAGKRLYETGVDRGVLYVYDSETSWYGNGVAWNGLTNVSENPSGAEPTALYADNIKYLNLISNEEFGATVEAYTYPDEFAECDGSAEIATINDSPEAITFSWEITTTPIDVAGYRPTACITIDSTKVNNSTKMTALEAKLYGTTEAPPTMPTIAQLLTIFGKGNG